MPVIDIHEHLILRPAFVRPSRGETVVTAEELVEVMDREGIDQMVALPATSPETFPFVQSNEEVFQACDEHPGRFIKFCNVDPRLENNRLQFSFVDILSYYKSVGAKGLGELTANLWWDDPRVQNLLRGCEEVGFPIIFHITGQEFNTYGLVTEPGLGGLERALQRFPKLQLIGHSPGFWSEVAPHPGSQRNGYPKGEVKLGGRVPELLRTYPSLWGDLSAGSGWNALARDPEWGYEFIDEFQDRLLMGLDICWPSGRKRCRLLGLLREAVEDKKITRRAYNKIMGGNAVKLLKLRSRTGKKKSKKKAARKKA